MLTKINNNLYVDISSILSIEMSKIDRFYTQELKILFYNGSVETYLNIDPRDVNKLTKALNKIFKQMEVPEHIESIKYMRSLEDISKQTNAVPDESN